MPREIRQPRSSLSQHAQLVAQAWLDPEFKARLLAIPATALREQGIFDVTSIRDAWHQSSSGRPIPVLPKGLF